MSAEHFDFLADYALLGIDPGNGLDAVRQAYRRAVQRVHPDRSNADDSNGDVAAMVAINLAYGRLCAFHREYGRLPLEPITGGGVAPRQDVPAAPVARRARVGVLVTFLLLVGTGATWLVPVGDPADDPVGAPGAPMQHLTIPATPPLAAAADPAHRGDHIDGIRLGDTAARVRRVLGPPILADRELWEYGPSHVRFERGRVVGWYSSPMKPLKIAESSHAARAEAGAR